VLVGSKIIKIWLTVLIFDTQNNEVITEKQCYI